MNALCNNASSRVLPSSAGTSATGARPLGVRRDTGTWPDRYGLHSLHQAWRGMAFATRRRMAVRPAARSGRARPPRLPHPRRHVLDHEVGWNRDIAREIFAEAADVDAETAADVRSWFRTTKVSSAGVEVGRHGAEAGKDRAYARQRPANVVAMVIPRQYVRPKSHAADKISAPAASRTAPACRGSRRADL